MLNIKIIILALILGTTPFSVVAQGGDYLTPIVFTTAFAGAYEIPRQLEADPWVSWAACSAIAVIDYKISLYRFPDEMEGQWNTSHKMSAVFLGTCLTNAVVFEILPEEIHDKGLDFMVTFVVGFVGYSIAHYLDCGLGPWE